MIGSLAFIQSGDVSVRAAGFFAGTPSITAVSLVYRSARAKTQESADCILSQRPPVRAQDFSWSRRPTFCHCRRKIDSRFLTVAHIMTNRRQTMCRSWKGAGLAGAMLVVGLLAIGAPATGAAEVEREASRGEANHGRFSAQSDPSQHASWRHRGHHRHHRRSAGRNHGTNRHHGRSAHLRRQHGRHGAHGHFNNRGFSHTHHRQGHRGGRW
jgi:hypothetical protein